MYHYSNVMIERHQTNLVKGYPMPSDYPSAGQFLIAHREWLWELMSENVEACVKLRLAVLSEKDSFVLAYLSGILHIRKEYSAFLRKGIEACDNSIEVGYSVY